MFATNIDFLVETALRRKLIHQVDVARFREYLAAGRVAFFSGEEIAQAVRDGMITIAEADVRHWDVVRLGITWHTPQKE